jgi:hypothetical protein
VAALLTIDDVSHLGERTDGLSPRDDREPGHAEISTTSSWMPGGTGSACASRLSR